MNFSNIGLKLISLSTVGIISPSLAANPTTAAVGIEAVGNNSKVNGALRFSQGIDGKVHIEGAIKGLKPNHSHGLHIHEFGACTGKDAKDAGDHFSVDKKPHGSPTGSAQHNGDLGNILANSEGVATIDIYSEHLSLDSKNKSNVLNRSIVVHEKADDLKNQPAGNSGGRIGCGIIKK